MSLHVITGTPSLDRTRAFFDSIGFASVSDEPLVLGDATARVEIDTKASARPSLCLVRPDATGLLASIDASLPRKETEHGHVVATPSGTWLWLKDGDAAPAEGDPPASALGNFMGISLESIDLGKSEAFWVALGFERTMGAPEQGWVALKDESGAGVSLMAPFVCPHSFVNPSLTYFNSGKNPEIIAELRKRDVSIYEEITAFNDKGEVDNVILREPGGVGFFVFND